MSDLQDAFFEVLDALDDIRTGCSFAETGCDPVVYVVREHELPAAGEAFFADVAFAVYDFCFVLVPEFDRYRV